MAPIVGPVTGGVIVDQLGWRWIFWLNIPIGVIGLLAALRRLPRDEPEEAGSLDWLGLATLGLGLPLMTYALTELGQGTHPGAINGLPLLAVGLMLIAFFIVHARGAKHPLLDLRLYAIRSFALSAAAITMTGATLFGPYLLIPLFFQQVRGDTAIEAGLLFGAQGLGAAAAMRLANRLHGRFGGPRLAFAGSIVMLVFTIPLALFNSDTSTALYVIDVGLRGAGAGLVMIPVFGLAFSELPRHHLADGNAQITVLMRVGAAAGTALIAVLLAHQLRHHGGDAAGMTDAFSTTWRWTLVIHVLALIPTFLLVQRHRQTRPAALETPG
jgi:MFS family permease